MRWLDADGTEREAEWAAANGSEDESDDDDGDESGGEYVDVD